MNNVDLSEGNYEWQQRLHLEQHGTEPIMLLCQPEDVIRDGPRCCRHAEHELCGDCRIPICHSCWHYAWSKRYNYRIPMCLANDNFWGYTTSLLTRYRVRWIEAAIVTPCWTNMLIYYVEGDHGHLMNEEMGQQKFRTVVRGSCASYQMPWEDILDSLRQNCADRDLAEVPHPEETLKYMLRVHLKVGFRDLQRHLKQVMVRPFVLVALLDHLIDKNHEVFRGKGSAAELRAKMRAAVEREYPEEEAAVPETERMGTIPRSIHQLLEESEKEDNTEQQVASEQKHKRRRLLEDKNATPGNGARRLEECLDDIRPHAICVDKSTAASSDPATLQAGAIDRYGDLHIQTNAKEVMQFHSKYFSQVLPFAIPHMCSGPDFFPDQRWRRTFEDSPWVSPQAFVAAFGRRVEAQCRSDWTALPIMRNVAFKWVAEHTMSTATSFIGNPGQAMKTSTKDLVQTLQNLYHKLHNGFSGV